MNEIHELDEIEVIDLEEHSCSGKPIPTRVKYYLIRVDNDKIRVQSPISAKEILLSAGLSPKDYKLEQKFGGGKTIELEPNQEVDLREPGVERFISVLDSSTKVIINGREKVVTDKQFTFKELIYLTFANTPQGPNVCFTVTYRNGPRKNPEGTMVEGDTVKIKKGMVFNVTATDKS